MKELNTVIEEMNELEEQDFVPFMVTDLETAAEAQRRIAYFNDCKAEIDSIVEKQLAPFLAKIEKIKSWGEQAKEEYEQKEIKYAGQLEIYLRAEVKKQAEEGKKLKKTIKLPYGKISLKSQQPEYQRNEDELLIYAKTVGLFKTAESADWAEIKKRCEVSGGKLIDENGEIVPGVTVVERDEKFEIKLDK